MVRCEVSGVGLLPDGFMDAKTNEQIMKCPWFWSKKKKQWFKREEWLPVYENLDKNPWDKDEDFV